MRWKAMKKTKDVIIEHLRMFLANKDNYFKLLPPEFEQDHFVKVPIYAAEPQELIEFPIVILSGGGGDMITGGIGDIAEEIYDPRTNELKAYRYAGMYDFSLTLEIGAKSTLEREVLTDLITIALKFILRRKVQEQGIVIKNVRYGGDSTTQYDSNHIYVSTINLSTWSEWYEDYELPAEDVEININKI